uniref:Aminotransferase-like plant mobile domain-containing protein n=1 Tax=Fagus sylvatica TaxID=28930 RepID=A0A2N9EUV3_FAGSY
MGTFHLSTCEMGVLLMDWSAILGIPFGGRAPPNELVSGPEALDILGIKDPSAIEGTRSTILTLRYLRDLLRGERDEPPTELRYRKWTTYFIFSYFLGNDKSTVPTPIVGMFRDVDTLRDYDWGALTYGFYIRGLRRFSRRETNGFLGFWHWDSARIQRLTACTLLKCRTTVDCIRDIDVLSRLRIRIRTPRSWELLMGKRTVRQLGGEAIVPVDPSSLMTIEGYIPDPPSDSYVEGVDYYSGLVQVEVPY